MRQQEETPERDARRCFGSGMHRSDYRAGTENHGFFWGWGAWQVTHSAHRISQVYTARSKGLHSPRSLTVRAPGEAEPHRGDIRQPPRGPASLNLIARRHYDREYSSNTFPSTQKSAAPTAQTGHAGQPPPARIFALVSGASIRSRALSGDGLRYR
jgi:hypothetical protein